MKPFEIYRHKNWQDVAIVPIKIFYVKESRIFKIKCKWINTVNPDHPFVADDRLDKIEIKLEDMGNWRLVKLNKIIE